MSALLVVHLPIPTLLMVVMVSAAVVVINNTGSLLTVVTDMVLTLFLNFDQLLAPNSSPPSCTRSRSRPIGSRIVTSSQVGAPGYR